MSLFSQIISDTALFPPANLGKTQPIDWSQGATPANIKQAVQNRLANFEFAENKDTEATGVPAYDELSKILPFSKNTAFFWRTSAYPTASLLFNSGYSVADQTAFLIFAYARLLGFMGIHTKLESTICADGSPAEVGWCFPTKSKAKPNAPNRQCAFLTEPLSPITGECLHGTDVLGYLVSPEGSLGCIDMAPDSLEWRNELEKFLYASKPEGSLPDNRHYYIAFYICAGEKVSLKTYFLPPFPTPEQPSPDSRLHRRRPVFGPISDLLPRLDSSLLKPYSKVEEYFATLTPENHPALLSISTDIVPTQDNRFKFYCYCGSDLSLRQTREFFTLGNRINQPEFLKGVEVFATLWRCLFPEAEGSETFNIATLMHRNAKEANAQHKIGGVGYYIDMKAGEEDPVTKIYIPARNYFANDAIVAERLQAFCDEIGYTDPLEKGRTKFVAEDIKHAFPHRVLDERSGAWVYISFALKRKGWEVGHYFSPENWIFFDKEDKE